MKYLIEIIVRYCKAANVHLFAANDKIDLHETFSAACEKSLISEQQFNKIKELLESK